MLSNKAKALLRTIRRLDEASATLTHKNKKAAQELVDNDLAIFIPKATGGADIALTEKGLEDETSDIHGNPHPS